MHILNQYFDNVYVLFITQEEFNNIKYKIKKENIKVEYFLGVDGKKDYKGNILTKGSGGHIMSFINILSDAINKRYHKILILEPDVYFCEEFSHNCKKYLDMDYKLLYLGASQHKFYNDTTWNNIEIQNYYYNAYKTLGTFAICIDSSIFKECVDRLTKMDKPTDVCLTDIQENYKDECFVAYPNIISCNVTNSSTGNSKSQLDAINNSKWSLKYFVLDKFKFNVDTNTWYEIIMNIDYYYDYFSIKIKYDKNLIFPLLDETNFRKFYIDNKIVVYIFTSSNKIKILSSDVFISSVHISDVHLLTVNNKLSYLKTKFPETFEKCYPNLII